MVVAGLSSSAGGHGGKRSVGEAGCWERKKKKRDETRERKRRKEVRVKSEGRDGKAQIGGG